MLMLKQIFFFFFNKMLIYTRIYFIGDPFDVTYQRVTEIINKIVSSAYTDTPTDFKLY